MANETPQNLLRLRKKHDPKVTADVSAADGARLIRAQSIRNALLASVICVLLFSVFWVALSAATNRVFPWITVVLGYCVGMSVRYAGRGLDWRFPALAAASALIGALLVNLVAAASVSAELLGTTTLSVLRNVTALTWRPFFGEVINAADVLFALVAAALAAFFASRRLTRRQNYSLRLWREDQEWR